jgi:hypothetical protein
MAKKENARYDFSLCDVIITPLNDDLSQPAIDNIIGGVGPFDYSGAVDPSAVEFISKIDSGAAETVTLDFVTPPVADINAVTVAEIVAAIVVAAPTDLTASVDTDGRLKIVYSGAGSPSVLQVYGEAATTALIGQGKGVKLVYSDTMQSFTDNPNLKDEEAFTTTDAKGVDTEVLSDGYRKGVAGVLTDTAMDYELRSIVEGGTIDANGAYSVPTSTDRKIYFKIELYSGQYLVGTNKEADLVGYIKEEIFSCKGTFGDRTRERGFVNAVYNYSATSPRDIDGNITSDTVETPLTVSEHEALNLKGLVA